ncbi:hypothetical protein LINGRAHAP2_LOCUS10989 [Linum grandiflorum]
MGGEREAVRLPTASSEEGEGHAGVGSVRRKLGRRAWKETATRKEDRCGHRDRFARRRIRRSFSSVSEGFESTYGGGKDSGSMGVDSGGFGVETGRSKKNGGVAGIWVSSCRSLAGGEVVAGAGG